MIVYNGFVMRNGAFAKINGIMMGTNSPQFGLQFYCNGP